MTARTLWEIVHLETGNAQHLTDAEAAEYYGPTAWKEIVAGYFPHIAAAEVHCGSGSEWAEAVAERQKQQGGK